MILIGKKYSCFLIYSYKVKRINGFIELKLLVTIYDIALKIID